MVTLFTVLAWVRKRFFTPWLASLNLCLLLGRFGNQAEQFLGSLLFALHLNRTLVLPPFIEYQNYRVNFLPFDQVFQIDPLLEKHRVITMEKFMEKYAPLVWSNGKRICDFIRVNTTGNFQKIDSFCAIRRATDLMALKILTAIHLKEVLSSHFGTILM